MRAATVRTLLGCLVCLALLGGTVAGLLTNHPSWVGCGIVLGSTIGVMVIFDALAAVYQFGLRRGPLALVALALLSSVTPIVLGAGMLVTLIGATLV